MRVGGAEVQLGGSLHGKTHNNWYKPFQSLNEGSLKFTLEVWELQCLTEKKKKKKGWEITVVIVRWRGSGKFFIPSLYPSLFINIKEQ